MNRTGRGLLLVAMTTALASPLAAKEPSSSKSAPRADDDTVWDGLSSNDKGAVIGFGVSALLLGSSLYSYNRAAVTIGDEGVAAYRKSVPAGTDACDAADAGFLARAPGAASPSDVREHCETSGKWKRAGDVLAVGG